jgi:excinuclease ABC subunit C
MDLSKIPTLPGVYIIKDYYDKIIYIGKAKNLKKRVSSYFIGSSDSFKTANIRIFAHKIDFIICDSEREALVIERRLINQHQPFFNVIWKDSKTYPYIVITDEDFPRIIITRKKNIKGKYFGPYPKVEILKKLIEKLFELKILNLRRCKYDFDLKNPLDHKKIDRCIYYHTNQCPSPCDPKKISKKDYYVFVKNAINFFNGKHSKLIEKFKEYMKRASDELRYEEAQIFYNAIKAIEHIYERVSVNETNLEEIEKKYDFTKTLLEAKEILNLKKIPYHIEAFDISNLLNRYAVGASVCFINGHKNKSHYRYFKIKNTVEKGSDDYIMIYEVVKRRLSQILKDDKNIPDLILIDGGKGQLNMAKKALDELGIKTDIISLAKKEELIYTLDKNDPICLEKDNKVLLFFMSIRDEIHRFVITYHRKLRSKEFLIE